MGPLQLATVSAAALESSDTICIMMLMQPSELVSTKSIQQTRRERLTLTHQMNTTPTRTGGMEITRDESWLLFGTCPHPQHIMQSLGWAIHHRSRPSLGGSQILLEVITQRLCISDLTTARLSGSIMKITPPYSKRASTSRLLPFQV